MKIKYLHTMVRVKDLEKTMEFYRLLGLKERGGSTTRAGGSRLVFMAPPGQDDGSAGGADLELGRGRGAADDSRHFGHLAYRVENIYEMCRHLMDNGVTINRPPRDGRMAFVRSPDNMSVELLQRATRWSRRSRGRAWRTPGTGDGQGGAGSAAPPVPRARTMDGSRSGCHPEPGSHCRGRDHGGSARLEVHRPGRSARPSHPAGRAGAGGVPAGAGAGARRVGVGGRGGVPAAGRRGGGALRDAQVRRRWPTRARRWPGGDGVVGGGVPAGDLPGHRLSTGRRSRRRRRGWRRRGGAPRRRPRDRGGAAPVGGAAGGRAGVLAADDRRVGGRQEQRLARTGPVREAERWAGSRSTRW